MNNPTNSITLGNAFKLLAACFYEPDRQLLREEHVCDNLISLLAPLTPKAASAAKEMKSGLECSTQQQLSIDYAALFVGPFELIAPPYGSIYLEGKRQVMGNSTLDIQKHYHDAGIAVDVYEPADHIAIELEFMYYLLMQEAEALHNNDENVANTLRNLQMQFFQGAMSWIPEFCILLHKGAETLYYKSLAECLESFHDSCNWQYSATTSEMGTIPCQ